MKTGYLALAAFVVIVCLSGPVFYFRPPASAMAEIPVKTTLELDEYLERGESAVSGLRPELAKGVQWVNSSGRQRTKYSIVYLHGFSASRRDVSPVVEEFGRALKANVYFARLTAHGLENGAGFAKVSALDWYADAAEAFAIGRLIGEKVILVGTSTGAALATLIAMDLEAQKYISSLILLSPNFGLHNWAVKYISGPLGGQFARVLIGQERVTKAENAYHEKYWTGRYSSQGIVALMNLTNCVQGLRLDAIKIPTLVIYTEHDKIVDVAAIIKSFESIGSRVKKIHNLKTAPRHELTGDVLVPQTVPHVLGLMRGFALEASTEDR